MQLVRLCYKPDHEKLKPQYLEKLRGQLEQFSLFLEIFSWFVGKQLTFVDFLNISRLRSEQAVWAQVPGWISKPGAFMYHFEALEQTSAYMQSDPFSKWHQQQDGHVGQQEYTEQEADLYCLICSILSLGGLYSIFSALLSK